ncbi:hypothetical protein [Streptomyces sp. STCH 565 A]|uniref:hypothetical protein n=1 Tax=Streptomyces sp. STCH 565 A TaxID=2950532 RepID=UPI00207647CE|nr:hypothetical protein [Streptomyces sp. STCH 565 A]MCM8552329.1 hypothetical protein [Streptomyces sp. STCH 565 A]
MDEAHENPSFIAKHLGVTPDGVYIDGHKLPAADEIIVEHVAPDFHIVSLKLYVKNFTATDHHLISETPADVYRYVHDRTGEQP